MRHDIVFGAQGFALLHAEPVLLVDDDEREVRGLERLGERGVRGDDDARGAAGRERESTAAGGQFHAAGQQDDRHVPRVRVRLRVRRAVLFPTACPTVFHGMFHGRAPLGISVIGSGFGGLDQVGRVIGRQGIAGRVIARLDAVNRAEHGADGRMMLLGEHLSRRDKHRLMAGTRRLQHGRDRDHGLAGTDLALQQALHRIFAGHVRADIIDDLPLAAGQRERQ